MSSFFTGFNSKWLALGDLCAQIWQRFNITVKKQAIDQRCNEQCVELVLLTKLLSQQLTIDFSFENYPFQNDRIKDSTAFQLPERLAGIFPGLVKGLVHLTAVVAGLALAFAIDGFLHLLFPVAIIHEHFPRSS